MTTKQKVVKAVEALGANMECGRTDSGVFEILIDAPEGQHWSGDGIHQLVESQWNNEPVEGLWQDALERIRYGLEPCDPEDLNCANFLEVIEIAQEAIRLSSESEVLRG